MISWLITKIGGNFAFIDFLTTIMSVVFWWEKLVEKEFKDI